MRATMPRSLTAAVAAATMALGAPGIVTAQGDGPGRGYALVGVRVLPMAGPAADDQTVLVRAGRIVAVGPSRDVRPAPTDSVLRFPAGTTVMPGLTDAHVHLEVQPATWMGRFLASGVTTVFNLRGDTSHLALRSAVEAGQVTGPRLYTSGGYANLPDVQSPEQADSLVRAQRAAGYDMVKIHGNLAPAAYTAMSAAATREGIALVGHAPRNLPFDSVLTARQQMVAHAEEILYTHFGSSRDSARVDSVLRVMAARGIWLTPTLAVFAAIVEQVGRPAVADSAVAADSAILTAPMRQFWRAGMYTNRAAASRDGYARNLAFLRLLGRRAVALGVPLLAGTDTPLPLMAPGPSLLRELEELVALGLGREAALATATRNAGRFSREVLRRPERFGVIEVGALAELVVVAGDPREGFGVLRRPLGVMAGGRWMGAGVLEGLRGAGA